MCVRLAAGRRTQAGDATDQKAASFGATLYMIDKFYNE